MIFKLHERETRMKLTEGRFTVRNIRKSLGRFSLFALFHATRVDDPGSFQRDGIRLGDSPSLDQRAREIFLTDEFRNVTEESLKVAIEKLGLRDHGQIWAVYDSRELVSLSGGYLIYGSERLVATANLLNVPISVLKRFGRPTLVEFHRSADELPEGSLDDLADSIVRNGKPAFKDGPTVNCSVKFETPIPSEAVVGWTTPLAIEDPFRSRSIFRFGEV